MEGTHRFRLPNRPVFVCPECGRTWMAQDDPNEWQYGHDCEEES
jgi:hypothetical protein